MHWNSTRCDNHGHCHFSKYHNAKCTCPVVVSAGFMNIRTSTEMGSPSKPVGVLRLIGETATTIMVGFPTLRQLGKVVHEQ